MEEIAQCDTETERELDDVMCSSDFKNTCSYSLLQRHVSDVFNSIHQLIELPEYHTHVREEAYMSKRKDIDKHLDSRNNDLMKKDCAIVFAGETSAGKSTVINLIIGEDILPTDIEATTSRICRLKYSDTLQISTCDSEDKQIQVTEYDDREVMAGNLSELAETKDDKIKYIDVQLPNEMLKRTSVFHLAKEFHLCYELCEDHARLWAKYDKEKLNRLSEWIKTVRGISKSRTTHIKTKGNVVIVDTPGIGYQDQEEFAKMMMDYIPNALAFVFVVNMGSAGGLQKDRLVRILDRVKGSFNQMHSFDPEDAIFLLNKWDTLVLNKRKKDLFEDTKDKLHKLWREVNDNHILKFAAARVERDEEYRREFDQFQQILKTIIAKNENKRIKVHIEFIRSFIEDCDIVVTGKINCARQTKEENVKAFDQRTKELQDTERTRQEAFENIQQNVDEFLEKTTKALHQYIHSREFERRILQGIEDCNRIGIGREMDSRIKKEICIWEQTHMEEMFERDVMEKVMERIISIHESLHRIKDKIKGLTSPFNFEIKENNPFVSFFANNGITVVGGILVTLFSVNRNAAIVMAGTGFVSSVFVPALVALGALDDVKTAIEKAFKARVGNLTTETIKQSLTKTYAEELKSVLQNFFEGDLKEEIDILKNNVASMRERVDYIQNEESSLISLSSAISKIRNRLKELENTEVKMD